MALTILLNGKSRTFPNLPDPVPVRRLLEELSLNEDRIALERNGEILPRTAWAETRVHASDKLELVHFVGGGAQEP